MRSAPRVGRSAHGAAIGTALLTIGLASGSCTVDRSILTNRPYGCTSSADCIDSYTCVHGPSLVEGFCAPRAGATCGGLETFDPTTQDRACLDTCNPTTASCANGFSCMRTEVVPQASLAPDTGACVGFDTCDTDADCTLNPRRTCLSIVVQNLLAQSGSGAFRAGGLSCLQSGCVGGGSCEPQYQCLATSMAALTTQSDRAPAYAPYDFCIPNCDPNGACPPGYGCFDAYQAFGFIGCIPYLPGALCADDLNCLLGVCLAVGGERRCTLPCSTQSDCDPLNSIRPRLSAFQCEGGVCVPYRPYYMPCQTMPPTTPCQGSSMCLPVPASTYSICNERCTNDAAGNALCAPLTLQHPKPACPDRSGYCVPIVLLCAPEGLFGGGCLYGGMCRSGTCTGLRCTCQNDCDCAQGVCNAGTAACDCGSDADCNGGQCVGGRCECTANYQCRSGMCDLSNRRCTCMNNGDCPLSVCSGTNHCG